MGNDLCYIQKFIFSKNRQESSDDSGSYSNKALNRNKTKILVNLTVGRYLKTEIVRGFGSENTDQRLAYFHLVAGTCPTNISHAGTSIICGDKSQGPNFGPCD